MAARGRRLDVGWATHAGLHKGSDAWARHPEACSGTLNPDFVDLLADLVAPAMVFQMGEPPRRIDVLTSITGVDFDEAWAAKSIHRVGEIDVPFLGRAALLANKRATGRTKDLADVEILERPERQQAP